MSTLPHTLEPVHFSPQTVYCGDCLDILRAFPANAVDLVYIDPPFNSNRNYEVFWGDTQEKRAFDDRHESTKAYIEFMRPRCIELARVLKKTGSFYYHCDWHASHYIKVMLDEVFGFQNFRTDITWKRTNAKGHAFKGFPNNHDSIFLYGKTDKGTWNGCYTDLDEGYVERKYNLVEPETGRRYMLDNLINPNPNRPNLTYEFLGIQRVWRWTKERMQRAYEEGRVIQPKSGSVPRFKR
jgi:DNA modification methylase